MYGRVKNMLAGQKALAGDVFHGFERCQAIFPLFKSLRGEHGVQRSKVSADDRNIGAMNISWFLSSLILRHGVSQSTAMYERYDDDVGSAG